MASVSTALRRWAEPITSHDACWMCRRRRLLTVEQAERDGGIRPDFADQVIPIYRKADE